MSAAHTRPLFARDLKYLVDAQHSETPGRKRRSLLIWSLCCAVIAAGALSILGLLVANVPTDYKAETKRQKPVLEARQIAAPSTPSENKDAGPGNARSDISGAVAPERAWNKAVTGRDGVHAPANQTDGSAISTGTKSEHAAATTGSEHTTLVWQDYSVKSGDSLAGIFTKHQLGVADAIRIANHERAGVIKKLVPGQKLRIGFDHENELRALSIDRRANKTLLIRLDQDGSIHVEEHEIEYDKREVAVSAVIESSLFKAVARAGLDDKFVLKLAGIFAWDIDFAKDLKKGDRFTVLYEQLVDGQKTKGIGDILAAEFINQDRKIYAFRHADEEGKSQYFDADGNSLRGTFLRTPMKVSRITSGFSKRRMHPILKEWRSHKGVDYAAPRGTPVLATADGRVSFLGRRGGYGKAIVLRHGSKYSTLYAHLSSYKSKLKPGSAIKQGQVIGFVGKTGMATAPHLHYEFRVHGQHRDPLSYDFPRAESIPGEEREKFLVKAQNWMQAMAQYNGIQLAQNEPSP